VARDLLDTLRNRPAVERLKRQGAQDEQVQRALRKINGSRWHHLPLLLLQELTSAVVEVQGECRCLKFIQGLCNQTATSCHHLSRVISITYIAYVVPVYPDWLAGNVTNAFLSRFLRGFSNQSSTYQQ